MNHKPNLQNAKQHQLFYVVATCVVYRESDGRCLILKRSSKEKTHPGLYALPGGKLEWEDIVKSPPTRINHDVPNWERILEMLVVREVKEESGVDIHDIRYLENLAYLRPDGIPTVCFKFAAKHNGGNINLSSDFESFEWVSEKEVAQFQCVKGIDREIAHATKIFSV